MKTETVTKNETIQNLYQQLESKSDFIKDVSKSLKKKPGTLKNHWFSCFFSIPETYEDQVIEMLEDAVSNQNTSNHE